jgi:microcystin degradation protein MlrC
MQAAGKIDVLLHLHNSMVTDDLDDGEGHVLEAIRWRSAIFPSSPP